MDNQQAPILTDDEIKAAAIEAGAVEMRENAFGIESFPCGCEFEIDQLRNFVGVVAARAVEVATAELRAELAEEEELRNRLVDLLTRTANAIRGEPEPLKRHGWQDLPERAQALMAELASKEPIGIEKKITER